MSLDSVRTPITDFGFRSKPRYFRNRGGCAPTVRIVKMQERRPIAKDVRFRWTLNGYQKFILIGIAVMLISATSSAKPDQKAFWDGIAAYKSGRYQEAVTAFKNLTDQGLTNPELFYNLGNAYLKNKDLGRAVLWYERAARLKGNDPDLKFNLAYARSLTKDVDSTRGPSLNKIFFFWKYNGCSFIP